MADSFNVKFFYIPKAIFDHFASLANIRDMAGPLRVSSSTVSRRLRIGAGSKARKPAVKPVLTDAQKQGRSFQLNTFIPRLLEGCNLV